MGDSCELTDHQRNLLWDKIDELKGSIYDIREIQAKDRARIGVVENRSERTLQDVSALRAEIKQSHSAIMTQLKEMSDYQQREQGAKDALKGVDKFKSWFIPLTVSTLMGLFMLAVSLGWIRGVPTNV